jgi:hypothetical protein
MHQITDDFREAPFGEGISGYARGAMLHLRHRIEKVGEAGASAMERLLGHEWRRNAVTDLQRGSLFRPAP